MATEHRSRWMVIDTYSRVCTFSAAASLHRWRDTVQVDLAFVEWFLPVVNIVYLCRILIMIQLRPQFRPHRDSALLLSGTHVRLLLITNLTAN